MSAGLHDTAYLRREHCERVQKAYQMGIQTDDYLKRVQRGQTSGLFEASSSYHSRKSGDSLYSGLEAISNVNYAPKNSAVYQPVKLYKK